MDGEELVSRVEIADLLEVTQQRVHQFISGRHGFPEPLVTLAIGQIWRRDDVLEWARRTRRLPNSGGEHK